MKRTGLNIICSLLLAGGMCACTATPKQTEEIKWSERMAQSEMQRFPEPWMIEKAKKPRWGYTHGLVVKSMLEEWKHTGDTAYYNYAKIYADSLCSARDSFPDCSMSPFLWKSLWFCLVLFL